jgi:hypothetical protein
MNTEEIQRFLDIGAQVVSKRATLGKSGEIFTIRFADSQPTYGGYSLPVCGGDIMEPETNHPRMDAGECGPDLFFEIWDFSDTPQELEPA